MNSETRADEHSSDIASQLSPEIEVFSIDLDASYGALEAAEQHTARLSADEIVRFDQKALALGSEYARRWRAAHIALRIVLERSTGAALRGVGYAIAHGGRPRVPRSVCLQLYPEFSLAHAGNAALIAVSRRQPVGIDVEITRDVRMSIERRARVVRAATQLAPDISLPVESDAKFLQSWVRLEALAKATGLGIGRILTEAGVVGGGQLDDAMGLASHQFHVADIEAGPARYAAIAAPDLPQRIDVAAFPAGLAELTAFLERHTPN